ncbi:MAG TPA: hypothetical protein DGO43_08205 [Chloroflexi bacterium]|nr:hypothetical protein [Chloroflexota bacterium]
MDLINGFPRSPYARLHNVVSLPSTIDKIRADLNGTLGEYVWQSGFSKWLIDFLGVHQDATRDAIATRPDDDSVWEWLQQNMQPRTNEDIARFNRDMIERRWSPERASRIQELCESIGKPGVSDIVTYFEWQDLEENRQAEYQSEPIDLSVTPPRDPYQKLLGLVNLPRTLDKARAELAGTTGDYIWRTGQSLLLLDFLGLTPDELFEALRTDHSDKSMCEWISSNMLSRSDVEIAFFNRGAIQNYPVTADRMEAHERMLTDAGLAPMTTITTAFERLCWDDALL